MIPPTIAHVELIGGPLCGEIIEWSTFSAAIDINYQVGLICFIATYALESRGKAKFQRSVRQ